MEEQRVQKFISISGLFSRKEVEKLIEEKKITVNDKIISLGDKCLSTDIIKIDGKEIEFNIEEKFYFILNKNSGYTSLKLDKFSRKSIFDLLKPLDNKSNLFSIGRLDNQTSGIIILTNDSGLSQKITHPVKKIHEEYIVTLNKKLDNKDKQKIEDGIILDGYQLDKCQIKILGSSYRIIIHQVRKRQIENLFEQFGYKIEAIKRTRIGNLNLNILDIKAGEYKRVNRDFLEKTIFNN